MKYLRIHKWILLLIPFVLLSFYSDNKYFKPLDNYLFDRDGYYFLIHENWIDNSVKIISNPFTLEKYKEQLEIRRINLESTPQFHFTIVKDNVIKEMIGYFDPSQVKMSKELERSFKDYKEKEIQWVTLSRYKELIDSLNNNGILWVGDQIKKYAGIFRIYVRISRDIETKNSMSEISGKLFDYLVSKYPLLTNRLDIFSSSSNPKENFVTWKIDILGNDDMLEFVKSINFNDNNLVLGSDFVGFTGNVYNLRYFESIY